MKMKKLQIFSVAGGWTFIGLAERKVDQFRLESAYCIRKWGTERGLGQLTQGPTAETVLDLCGVVHMMTSQVYCWMDCNPEAWEKWFK